jgi:hypothetical protein
MPRLSGSMEECTVLEWHVAEGGEVRRGDPLAEIDRDHRILLCGLDGARFIGRRRELLEQPPALALQRSPSGPHPRSRSARRHLRGATG